jgi:glycosyltransferase involved in cell wall biosynthesis
MHLLFYDDATDFGGHEVMTLQALQHLLEQPGLRVAFMFQRANHRLAAQLEAIRVRHPALELHDAPYATGAYQGLRDLFARRKVADLAQRFRRIGPDGIVLVQGSIEISSLGALAAAQAGSKAITYIPYAHSLRVTGARFAALRDVINHPLYRLPQGYITSSQSACRDLAAWGVRAPIEIVYSGVDTSLFQCKERLVARQELCLPENACVAAIVGRIYFKQKAHDFLLRALAKHRERLGNLLLLVVGDGPDLAALRALVAGSGIADRVRLLPWTNDLTTLYSAIDLLVLPSHYEGFPGVVLEAMHCGLPIVATDRDGMRELLPPHWRFPTGDSEALIETLLRVKSADTTVEVARHKTRIRTELNQQAYGPNFQQALLRLLQRGGA